MNRNSRLIAATVYSVMALVLLGVAADAFAQTRGRARIAGRVTDQAGNPVAGATIVLTHLDSSGTLETTTDDDGQFVVGNMGRGNWNIDVVAPGYLPAAMSARLSEEQRLKDVQIELVAGDAGSGVATTFGPALTEAVVKANEYYVAGDFAAATLAFEALLTQFSVSSEPNLPLVNINVGNSAYEAGDYARARAAFEAALAAFPESTDARLGLAKCYMMERNIDAAVVELEKLDLAEIRDSIVFYNIGSLLFDQGQSANAATYYELALQRNPNFADAHMQLAICFISLKKNAEARPHLQKVIDLDPDSANAALAQEFLASIQ